MEGKNTQADIRHKTIYDSSYGEIFVKNFLAGLGGALAGVVVQVAFLIIGAIVFVNVVLPHITPILTNITELTESFKSLSEPQQFNLRQFLGQ